MKKEPSTLKEFLIRLFIAIIVAIVSGLLTNHFTSKTQQAAIVENLASAYDYVDASMTYKEALQAVYEKNSENEKTIAELSEELQNVPTIDFKDASLVKDGLMVDDSTDKSVVFIEKRIYFAANLINQYLTDGSFYYDEGNNTVFFSNPDNVTNRITKVDLFDTNVLYDGKVFRTVPSAKENSFSMGSKIYYKGFIIADDHTLFGDGDGYALFDLQNQYSAISFDVGRTTDLGATAKQDVVLKVYLDGEYVNEYKLDADSPPINLTINLNYAKSLKLEIMGGSRVIYGFANALLYY